MVASVQVRALVREYGVDLLRTEHGQGRVGDHNLLVAARETEGGGRRVVDDQYVEVVVPVGDQIDDLQLTPMSPEGLAQGGSDAPDGSRCDQREGHECDHGGRGSAWCRVVSAQVVPAQIEQLGKIVADPVLPYRQSGRA